MTTVHKNDESPEPLIRFQVAHLYPEREANNLFKEEKPEASQRAGKVKIVQCRRSPKHFGGSRIQLLDVIPHESNDAQNGKNLQNLEGRFGLDLCLDIRSR